MSKFFNLCCKHSKTIDENDQISYQKVGVVKLTDNGGWYLNMYHQPDTEYRIFSSREDNLPVIE